MEVGIVVNHFFDITPEIREMVKKAKHNSIWTLIVVVGNSTIENPEILKERYRKAKEEFESKTTMIVLVDDKGSVNENCEFHDKKYDYTDFTKNILLKKLPELTKDEVNNVDIVIWYVSNLFYKDGIDNFSYGKNINTLTEYTVIFR